MEATNSSPSEVGDGATNASMDASGVIEKPEAMSASGVLTRAMARLRDRAKQVRGRLLQPLK